MSGESELAKTISASENLDDMAGWVVNMCKKRGWSMHWTHRGAYLHLESSELIEAIRGKGGDPKDEAGDVLLVLMSITEYAGIPFTSVVQAALEKLKYLEEAPPYPNEERGDIQTAIEYLQREKKSLIDCHKEPMNGDRITDHTVIQDWKTIDLILNILRRD